MFVTTVILLLAGLAVGVAVVWRAVPDIRRRRAEEEGAEPFEFAAPGTAASAPAFAFRPVPVREELPPRSLSIARIVFAVALVSGLIAALAWTLGSLVNAQLARILTG